MGYTPDECDGPPGVLKIRFKGVFDYNGLHKMILGWLYDHNYEVTEGKHKHKMSCPHGFEIERDFDGERKIDDFLKYVVQFRLHFWDAQEVEVVKDGKKVKYWKGRLELKSGMKVIADYQGKWDTPFKAKLLKFFCEYIIKKELIVKHMDPLYYHVLSFHDQMKKHLDMTAIKTKF